MPWVPGDRPQRAGTANGPSRTVHDTDTSITYGNIIAEITQKAYPYCEQEYRK